MMLWIGIANAQLTTIEVTPKFIETNGTKIIDIRTLTEWKETGIVKGAYTITFFDERGGFDMPKFLETLNRVVKKEEPFALICRTGSRTKMVSQFLSNELGYKVIDLSGGVLHLIKKGYKLTPYHTKTNKD